MKNLEECASEALSYLITSLEENPEDTQLENLIEEIMDILGRY